MDKKDWRSEIPYNHLRRLDAPGFAWEFLKRNPAFERERLHLEQSARDGSLEITEADVFAAHWGVRFREGRRRRRRRRRVGPLDVARPAVRHCLDHGLRD
jgi:hypothetical protein